MRKWLSVICTLAFGITPGTSHADDAPAPSAPGPAKVVVIPVRAQISPPELYILRRGLKEAIDHGVQTVVLDMNTPGGNGGTMLEMLKAIEKFPGKTYTFVNNEAGSAGALIAAGTDEIYFAPDGVMGSAAPVNADGSDLEPTMRAKVVSFMKARVRTITSDKGYRSEVLSAMIDKESEFKIGEAVIKPKGELLTLTAAEAMKEYGEPPAPLLGAGIAEDIDGLLDTIHGKGNWSATRLEVSWSEKLAQYLTGIAPILMAIGMAALFIEFKTPGFGFFGLAGGLILAVVFLGHYVAGLSGHEPALFFALGILLVVAEIFFFPGSIAIGIAGVALMLGSLVWSMADLWPSQPIPFTMDVFLQPMVSVAIGLALAILIFVLIFRYLPKGGPWGNMVLNAAVGGEPGGPKPILAGGSSSGSLLGKSGLTMTAMRPSGQVEIDGRRYEAKLSIGSAEAGVPVTVTRHGEFSLEVEEMKS